MNDLVSLGDTSKANTPHKLILVHPDTKLPLKGDDGVELSIDFVGPDSDEAREANHENRRISVQRAADGMEFDPQIDDDGFYRLLSYVSTGWTGIPQGWIDGTKESAPAEFSRENAFKLYKRLRWVRQQLNTKYNRAQNFGKASLES